MATLSANSKRNFEVESFLNTLPVVASDIIYQGSAVGSNAGYARPLTTGDKFMGFAAEKVDNACGAAGDKNIAVRYRGLVQLAVASAVITSKGDPVYASDDDTFVLTSNSGANTYIGVVHRFISAGVVIVAFDATGPKFETITELTDSTTGTADNTVADVTASFSQSILNNNFADLVAKVNEILRQIT